MMTLQDKFFVIPSKNGPRSRQRGKRKNEEEPQLRQSFKLSKPTKREPGRSQNVAVDLTADHEPLHVTPVGEDKFFVIPSKNGPRSRQRGKRKNEEEPQLRQSFKLSKPTKREPGRSQNVAVDLTADHEPLHVTPVGERVGSECSEATESSTPTEIAGSDADSGLHSRRQNTVHPNNNLVSRFSVGSRPTEDTLARQDNDRNNRIQALLDKTKGLQEMCEQMEAAAKVARDNIQKQAQEESTEHEILSSETIPRIPENEHEHSPNIGTETLAGESLAEISQMNGLLSKTDRTNQPKEAESLQQSSDLAVASTDHSQSGFEAPLHLTAHYDQSFSDIPPTAPQICLSTSAEYSPLRSNNDQPSETGYHGQPSESLPFHTPLSSQLNYDTTSKMSFVPPSQFGNRSDSLQTPPVPPPFPKEIVSGTHDRQQTSETSEAHSFTLTSFQAKPSSYPSATAPQNPPQLRYNGETLLNPSMPSYHSPVSGTGSHHQLPELSASNRSPTSHTPILDSHAMKICVSTPTPDTEEFENKQTDYFQQIGDNEEAVGELSEKFRPPEAEAGLVIDEPQRENQRPGSELSEERDQSSEERGQSHVEQDVHISVPPGGLKDEAYHQDEGREQKELHRDVEKTHFSTDVIQEKFPNVQPEASRRKEGKEKTKEVVLKEIEDTIRAGSRGSEGDRGTEGVEEHEDEAKENEGLGLEESRKEEETVKLKDVLENESIETENETGAMGQEKDSQRVMQSQDELVEAEAKIRDFETSEQREEIETPSQAGRENEKESEEGTKQPKITEKESVELVKGNVEVPEEEIKQAEIIGREEVEDKEQDEQGDVTVLQDTTQKEKFKTDQDKENSEGGSETGQNIPEEDTMSEKKQEDEEVVGTNVSTGGIEREKETTPSKLGILSPSKIKEKFFKKESTRPEEAGEEDIASLASKGESGIPSLVVVEEQQGGEEKTHSETVSEKKKKEDVKQSTRKGSVLSLKSLSKEPHSFKHVIFDQKAEFFNDVNGKWEKLGSGNLTISVDEKKKAELEFLDGDEQIAIHPVRKETQLVPARGTDRAYVWTTEAHIKREKKAKKVTLFVRFGEADTANQFQEEFQNVQSEEKIAEMLKSRRKQAGEGEEVRIRSTSKESSGYGSMSSGDVESQKKEGNLEGVPKESKEDKKQSTLKGSSWSPKSTLKEPHRFKHVIFDQKANLFKDVKGRWEKLGSGDLTISVDEKKKAELELLDGDEQIIRHPVRKETQLVPARGTDRAYVWTTEAHTKREKKAKKMTLFVRFKEADTADQFQEEFQNAQSEEKLAEMLKSRRKQAGGDAVSLAGSIPEEQQATEVEGDQNPEKEGEGGQIRVEASKNAGEDQDQRGKIKADVSDETEVMKIKIDEAEKSRDVGEKTTEGTEIIGEEGYESETPTKDKSAVEGTPLGKSKDREQPGETPETKLEEEDVSEVNSPVGQEQQKHRDGEEDGKTDVPVAEKSVGGGKEERGAESQVAETDDGDEVIFTAEAELFYDKDGKWDKQGSGVIKIVNLHKDGTYQVRMKKGDTFIANHRVKKETQLVPARGDDRCYVWTTENSFSVGKPKKTTFFARFKTYSDAESFRRHFEEGQTKKKKLTPFKLKLGKEKR